MAVLLNVRQVESGPVTLAGEVSLEELALGVADELMRPQGVLAYTLIAEAQAQGVLIQGSLRLGFSCTCARCLEPFGMECRVDDWSCLLVWEGEEAALVKDDCVDLTPYMRQDMVLALPQRPLCRADCAGIRGRSQTGVDDLGGGNAGGPTSVWSELDKLRF